MGKYFGMSVHGGPAEDLKGCRVTVNLQESTHLPDHFQLSPWE